MEAENKSFSSFCEQEPYLNKLLTRGEFLKEVCPDNEDLSIIEIDLDCDIVPVVVKD